MDAIVADTNPVYRFGLSTLIKSVRRFECIHEVTSIQELNQKIDYNEDAILLIDPFFYQEHPTENLNDLLNSYSKLKVIIVLRENYSLHLSKVRYCGAMGFILRNSDKSEICEAIKKVSNNQHFYSSLILNFLNKQNSFTASSPPGTFELNLLSIMFLIYHEKSSKEIASICNLSCRTVEDYRKKILRITNSINIAGIIKYVFERNIHNNEYLILKYGKYCVKKDLQEIDFIR